MYKILFVLLIPTIILIGCNEEIPNQLNWEVKDFEAENQDGELVSLSDLEGKVWIADFIFTNCTTVCPPMTMNMVELQQELNEENLSAEFISFSIDPERDTQDIRKSYIEERGGDL